MVAKRLDLLRMGVCACRSRQYEENSEFSRNSGNSSPEEETQEQRWRRFAVGAQRIAYKRRQWAALGHWLRTITRGER